MVSQIKKHLSTKIYNILKSNSLISCSNEENLISKINYFTRIPKINKKNSSPSVILVRLKSLEEHRIIDGSLTNELKKKLENLNDDLIKNALIKGDYLEINTEIEQFKKAVISTIFNQNDSYGFVVSDNDLYLKQIDNVDTKWMPKKTRGKTLVEFSSPNIAKPLHAGHMRSTFIGNFISNLHHRFQDETIRINYLGDWGTQYGILAVGFKKFGSIEKLQANPMRHLLEVYKLANENEDIHKDALNYFSQMETDDHESIQLWKQFRELSIKELTETYNKLNITFDVYDAESYYFGLSKSIIQMLMDKQICKKMSDNAYMVDFTSKLNNQDRIVKYVVQKQDGSTLYITRDIAALLERKKKFNFSKIVYVVDSAQTEHFKNLYQTIKLLEPKMIENIQYEEFYVPFGRFTNMSTRQGQVMLLSDLINEAKEIAAESMKASKNKKYIESELDSTAQIIGTSHLIISNFRKPRIKDFKFSWSNVVENDDSAYTLHSLHARLCSLIERAQNESKLIPNIENINFKLLNKECELRLIQHLAQFEEIIWKSYVDYEGCIIVDYLFELMRFLNKSLRESYVSGEENDVAQARLCMYYCARQVLSNSLKVLGITPLNRI